MQLIGVERQQTGQHATRVFSWFVANPWSWLKYWKLNCSSAASLVCLCERLPLPMSRGEMWVKCGLPRFEWSNWLHTQVIYLTFNPLFLWLGETRRGWQEKKRLDKQRWTVYSHSNSFTPHSQRGGVWHLPRDSPYLERWRCEKDLGGSFWGNT